MGFPWDSHWEWEWDSREHLYLADFVAKENM